MNFNTTDINYTESMRSFCIMRGSWRAFDRSLVKFNLIQQFLRHLRVFFDHFLILCSMYFALARVVALCSKFRKINDGNLNNKALFIKRKIFFFCHFFFLRNLCCLQSDRKAIHAQHVCRASCKSLQSERVFFFLRRKKVYGRVVQTSFTDVLLMISKSPRST